jgi:hypothetical protein
VSGIGWVTFRSLCILQTATDHSLGRLGNEIAKVSLACVIMLKQNYFSLQPRWCSRTAGAAQQGQWLARGWTAGVRFPVGAGVCLFSATSGQIMPPPPTSTMVPEALSLGLKGPKRDAGHSPPSSTDVKNVWSKTYTLLHGIVSQPRVWRWLSPGMYHRIV